MLATVFLSFMARPFPSDLVQHFIFSYAFLEQLLDLLVPIGPQIKALSSFYCVSLAIELCLSRIRRFGQSGWIVRNKIRMTGDVSICSAEVLCVTINRWLGFSTQLWYKLSRLRILF